MATAVIAVAAAVGGSLAGAAAAATVSGAVAQIAVGAVVGAVVGGAISTVGALITGHDTSKAFKSGLISGGLAGAIGGGFVAINNATALSTGSPAAGMQASGAGIPFKTSQAGLLQEQPAVSAAGATPVEAGVTAVNPTAVGGAGAAPVEAGATAVPPVGNVAKGLGTAIAKQPTQQAGLLSTLGKIMPKSEFGKFALLSAGTSTLGNVLQGMSEDERAAEAERLVEEKRQRLNTSLLGAALMSPPMGFGAKDNSLFFSPSYSSRYLRTM